MASSAQGRALRQYRERLSLKGMARFEVLGRDTDRELIRALARRLASDDAESVRLRSVMTATMAQQPAEKGGVFAALRRSPLVGADLDIVRERIDGRDTDL
jgi:hypothetical protein